MDEMNRNEEYREDSNREAIEMAEQEQVQEQQLIQATETESLQMQETVQQATAPETGTPEHTVHQNPGVMQQSAQYGGATQQDNGMQYNTQQNVSYQTATQYGGGTQNAYPYGQPMYQNNPYQNPAYQNNPYYGQPVYSPYGNPAYMMPPKKQRKPSKFLKFLGIAVASLFFGLLAGGSFIGVNYLYDTFGPQEEHEYVAPGPAPEQGIPAQDRIESSTVLDSEYIQGTSVSDIAENAMPSTVSITCTFLTDSWFGRYETPGSGSGIIVGKNEKELLIVTNNHVVDGANSIKVVLIDGTEAEAEVKGTAASTDLAVIAVRLEGLEKETLDAIKIAKLGNSNDIKVGEMVVAIGNALGYGQSVTVGYISAKDREVIVDNTKMTLLQTDAAINPGNSGGALLNLDGEVIGINSVKYADEDVEGMCFAIPVSNVEDIIQNLMNSLSEEERGYLGVGVNDVTEAIAEYYNWPVGVYVVNFSENSAAEEAGIQIGDIITGVNGVVVETANELIERVTSNRYGTKVTITLQRNVDGEYQEFEVDVVLRQQAEFVENSEADETEKAE